MHENIRMIVPQTVLVAVTKFPSDKHLHFQWYLTSIFHDFFINSNRPTWRKCFC